MKTNDFTITSDYLLRMFQSPACAYKNLKTPVFVRHHGRSLKKAKTFSTIAGYPRIIMLVKDPNLAQEVLETYPQVEWAKEYYTSGCLINSQKGAWDYCRDHGFKTCVLLDDDIHDFSMSFYKAHKMYLASYIYFPYEAKEVYLKILAYSIRRALRVFKDHPAVGMVGWHHRSFGNSYGHCNTVDINGGYNDFANGYIYNIEAMDRFGFKLPNEWDSHGDNVGIYCEMLNRGMDLACLSGANISPSNDGDHSTLRTKEDAVLKTESDWNNCQALTPAIVPGLRRQKTGNHYVKIDWKHMNATTGHVHIRERLFDNPDDQLIKPEDIL